VIVISRQLNYLQSRDLGFNQAQKLILPIKDDQVGQHLDALRNELTKLKDITGVSGCSYYPSKSVLNDFLGYAAGGNVNTGKMIKVNRADENFFGVMGIPIIAGRNLRASDSGAQVVVNRKMLEALDIEVSKAVGAKIYSEYDGGKQEYDIVGVINDYNFSSLKEEIQPLAIFYSRSPSYVIIQAATNDYKGLLADIAKAWKNAVPNAPFEYSFLDEDIQKQYAEENTLKKISNSFTLLAILISCLGLFGLAMFTAQQRIKEIGVRKVLGASVTGIVSMLSKDFLKLVLISILIASPIAWWAMTKWLEDFAYKETISWWVFALAGVLALLVALVTISFQAIRAAVANPVKSLRSE
jgi:putative ABC transport system permease protein